jgi:hypothetical protein
VWGWGRLDKSALGVLEDSDIESCLFGVEMEEGHELEPGGRPPQLWVTSRAEVHLRRLCTCHVLASTLASAALAWASVGCSRSDHQNQGLVAK